MSRRSSCSVTPAVELLDRAADLLSDSAGLVHDNERRCRVFRARVVSLTDVGTPPPPVPTVPPRRPDGR